LTPLVPGDPEGEPVNPGAPAPPAPTFTAKLNGPENGVDDVK
jgi:hypothetical protein